MKRILPKKVFKYSCTIDISPGWEIILDKLINLGYIDCWTDCITTDELKTLIWSSGSRGACGLTGFKDDNYLHLGNNDNLFLAIAAINDEDDYMTWFTNGEDWYQHKEKNLFDTTQGLWHKASADELIINFHKIKI